MGMERPDWDRMTLGMLPVRELNASLADMGIRTAADGLERVCAGNVRQMDLLKLEHLPTKVQGSSGLTCQTSESQYAAFSDTWGRFAHALRTAKKTPFVGAATAKKVGVLVHHATRNDR